MVHEAEYIIRYKKSYQFVFEYNIVNNIWEQNMYSRVQAVFRMYATHITFPCCEEQRALPTSPSLSNPIRIFQANSIGRVELSFDENVLKCF
jgi:hypothetical protein